MKILFVQSYLGRKEPPVMPIGLAYLATAVPEHDVKLIDLNLHEKPYEILASTLREFRPDVVGLSIRNIDSQQRKDLYYYYKELPKTLNVVKEAAANAVIVTGGAGFSMFAKPIMERHTQIDFGVYQEGEETFPALLRNLDKPAGVPSVYYRENGTLKFSGQGSLPDFKALPIPRKDIVDIKAYRSDRWAIGVHTKRGCPFKCSYCNYPLLNGLKVRMRDPIQVVDEIEDLVKNHGVTSFMFADGVFSSPFAHVKDICNEIVRRGIKANWCAWCDVKDITEEFLATVSAAGCNFIVISPDAFSDNALNGLNKGFSTQDIRKAFALLKKWPGIKIGYGFFLTPPGETVSGYIKTLLFYFRQLVSLIATRKGGGGLSWVRIEPDTKVYEIALREGIVTRNTDLLPESEDELKKLFYVNPRLRLLDPLSVAIVGLLNFKKFLRPRR